MPAFCAVPPALPPSPEGVPTFPGAGHYLSAIVAGGDVWVADQTAERIVRLTVTNPRRNP